MRLGERRRKPADARHEHVAFDCERLPFGGAELAAVALSVIVPRRLDERAVELDVLADVVLLGNVLPVYKERRDTVSEAIAERFAAGAVRTDSHRWISG